MEKQWTIPELIDFIEDRCIGIDQTADALRWKIIRSRDTHEPSVKVPELGGWRCDKCQEWNYHEHANCQKCSAVKSSDGQS